MISIVMVQTIVKGISLLHAVIFRPCLLFIKIWRINSCLKVIYLLLSIIPSPILQFLLEQRRQGQTSAVLNYSMGYSVFHIIQYQQLIKSDMAGSWLLNSFSPDSAYFLLLLLLLSRFNRVWLCAIPETAAHQAPSSLGFSRQEHWSGLPFPSPMHESKKWKWRCSVMSDS